MIFTLFTPVFNREVAIERVWLSIQRQTTRDFEWICVDDCSMDRSLQKLEEYKAVADFPMTVIKMKKNSGKHAAWNRAVAIAQGELFVPCDSDDEFDADTLEFFARSWSGLSEVERTQASGINVLCRDAITKHIVGTPFPQSPMWSNNLELHYRFNVTGEKWGCIRSDILRRLPFPAGQGYSPESYLWFSIARTHRVLCFNRALRTYYHDQPNGISTRTLRVERLPASYDYACWHLRENWDYISMRPLRLLSEGSSVFLLGLLIGRSCGEVRDRLRGAAAANYWPLFALVGWLRYHKRKWNMHNSGRLGTPV